MNYYYDFSEYLTLKDKIVWTENRKLKYSDFNFTIDPELKNLDARIGLHSRFNTNDPILFRSHTVFEPKNATISDTTDPRDLRVAQVKFDLLETYRRRMEKEVNSLRKSNVTELYPSDFDKMHRRYYSDFTKEWLSYSDSIYNIQTLERLEKKVKTELK
ncbi:hypothetical protein [Formosa sp. L2A11]|uniref:hypothetical protein n=1 Tax=Formosa sp. L2A11 TaxID=2686363 RepID=UPI00131C2B5D|nr:hypothetical protein [Formosa sp. L2A11]